MPLGVAAKMSYDALLEPAAYSCCFESVFEVKTVLNFVRQSLKLSSYSPRIMQLYRAGRDGDKGHTFQQIINKKSDVVIIMKMIDGTKFGGYLHREINRDYDKTYFGN